MQFTIAIAQIRPRKGDYPANLARLREVFAQLAELDPRPDVLALAETALTGYFLEGGVRDAARTAGAVFADLQAAYRDACGPGAPPLDIIAGFYERFRDRYYNSALYATLGDPGAGAAAESPGIRHVHRKVFLPTYGVFDDARFVEAGHHIAAFDTRYGRAALLICEDAWHSISGAVAALDGAQVVFVVSASPARGVQGQRPGNVAHWEELVQQIAREHGVFGVLAQLVGFEGGKGFPGASLIVGPRGDRQLVGPIWEEALLHAVIDLDELPLARADLPLLADLETMLPHLEREIERAERGDQALVRWDDASAPPDPARAPTTRMGDAARLPVVSPPLPNTDESLLRLDGDLVRAWLVAFLRDEVRRRRGFQDVALALSGDVDSALIAFLCAEAFGPEHVYAIRMPYRAEGRDRVERAQVVIDQLGLRGAVLDISGMVDAYARLEPEIDDQRREQVAARARMIVLADQAQKLGAMPIGSGNKTERLFGSYAWHADASPPINPLGDLFASQVRQLARHVGVPAEILGAPHDEAGSGLPYALADRILHFLLMGYDAAKLARIGFAESDVALVRRRLDSTHWKRRLPSTAMLSATAIGEYYLRPVDY